MGHPDSKESDLVVDLESGGNTSEEEGGRNPSSSGGIPAKKTLGRAWSGIVGFDGCIRSADSVSICKSELNYGGACGNSVDSLVGGLGEEQMEFVGKKMNKEKRKKIGSKKPSKPPRAPRGPSLDAADMKMVREITELAMMKRARVERMKALKMKTEKASSLSCSNFIAMIITILFCFIFIFQGICSRSSSSNMSFHGSPETAGDGGMISIEHSMNPPATETNGPGSGFPSYAESASLQQAALQDGRKEFRGK